MFRPKLRPPPVTIATGLVSRSVSRPLMPNLSLRLHQAVLPARRPGGGLFPGVAGWVESCQAWAVNAAKRKLPGAPRVSKEGACENETS
jgi:hypothetical protein